MQSRRATESFASSGLRTYALQRAARRATDRYASPRGRITRGRGSRPARAARWRRSRGRCASRPHRHPRVPSAACSKHGRGGLRSRSGTVAGGRDGGGLRARSSWPAVRSAVSGRAQAPRTRAGPSARRAAPSCRSGLSPGLPTTAPPTTGPNRLPGVAHAASGERSITRVDRSREGGAGACSVRRVADRAIACAPGALAGTLGSGRTGNA
jgi:hypothetical protein